MLFAEQKRDTPEGSETAIDESSRNRNTAYLSCDERKPDYSSTGDKTKGDPPLMMNRISI